MHVLQYVLYDWSSKKVMENNILPTREMAVLTRRGHIPSTNSRVIFYHSNKQNKGDPLLK